MKDFSRYFFQLTLSLVVFFFAISPASAYYTNMPADVVIGQNDFTSGSANSGGSTSSSGYSSPYSTYTDGTRLFVSDYSNNRVLIYNEIPTSNGATADVVIGQTNFTNNSANQGGSVAANTLKSPAGVIVAGSKLIIVDYLNNRVLIYNQIPTTNNASADVVIGQANLTSNTYLSTSTGFGNPWGVDYDEKTGKLIIAGYGNNRVLIYNSIPSTDGTAADVVIGQANFDDIDANQGGSVGGNTLYYPYSARIDNGKVYIADNGNSRILIYNSIPTTNNTSANFAIGQTNLTDNGSNQGGSVGANTLYAPVDSYVDSGRLFVQDRGNHRTLIFNTIPTSSNPSADLALGQPDLVSGNANQGGSITATTQSSPEGHLIVRNNQLFVTDKSNHRILIYNNVVQTPGLSIDNSPENRNGDLIRLTGNTSATSPYVLANVEYSINNGDWHSATADDGSFNSISEKFYFDFDPTENQPRDSDGNLIEGYTIKVRSTNNNADRVDSLFYFSPFGSKNPSESSLKTPYPEFEFNVNKQKEVLKDNLSHYQIKIKRGNNDWQTLIDNIPIDFGSRKNDDENLQKETWEHLDVSDGQYEADQFLATYNGKSSQIKVQSKDKPMSGSYQWKAVAVDKVGHIQETGVRDIYVSSFNQSSNDNTFPLAILNISGIGNPYLNNFNLSRSKTVYKTFITDPTFYGIAWGSSQVSLKMTKQECSDNCTKTYTTTANSESRFGINIPKGDLIFGNKYDSEISVSLNNRFNQLPTFTLGIGL